MQTPEQQSCEHSSAVIIPIQRFIQALFCGRSTALETQSLIQFLNSVFEGRNSTIPDLHLNQT